MVDQAAVYRKTKLRRNRSWKKWLITKIGFSRDLTHISLASFFGGTNANSADPDQTPHYAASDQGLHRLLRECYIKL